MDSYEAPWLLRLADLVLISPSIRAPVSVALQGPPRKLRRTSPKQRNSLPVLMALNHEDRLRVREAELERELHALREHALRENASTLSSTGLKYYLQL